MALLGRFAAALSLAAALSFLPAPALAATTYYVSPDGDDDAAGTSTAGAWRTPARVDAVDLAPGDRVLFEGDETFAGGVGLDAADAGTAAAPVVVGSYGGGRATLRPGDQPGLYAEDVGGLVVRDLRFEGPGLDVSETDGLAIFAGGQWGQRLAPVVVERVEATGFGRWGVGIGSWAGPAGFDGIDLADVDAHGNALGGVLTYAQERAAHRSVTVRRSRAWDNPGRAGLTRNSGNGIVLGGVDGGLIEGCVAHGNGGRDTAHEGGVGIWTYDSRGVVIQGNLSYANRTGGVADGGGFDLDAGVSDSVVQYNRSSDNDGAGFLLANPSRDSVHGRNVVRFNLSEGDGRRNGYAGITLWRRTADLDVYHNTVVGPAAAVRSSGLDDGSAAVRNNLFVRTTNGPVVSVAADATTTAFQGNAYWAPGGAPRFDWAGHRHVGLAAWRTAAGQERIGATDTGIEADPALDGAAPAAGSPLIDAALDLELFGLDVGDRDLLGTALPVGADPDVGAIEASRADGQPGEAPTGQPGEPAEEPPVVAPRPSPDAASTAAPAGAGDPARPLPLARGQGSPVGRVLASPRLRIVRAARRGRRVRVVGRTSRGLPAGSFVRVRLRRGRTAGRSVRASIRRGRFSALAVLPSRKARGALRVDVSYAGDATHRAQRRGVRLSAVARARQGARASRRA
jgi:hypothetical protein